MWQRSIANHHSTDVNCQIAVAAESGGEGESEEHHPNEYDGNHGSGLTAILIIGLTAYAPIKCNEPFCAPSYGNAHKAADTELQQQLA